MIACISLETAQNEMHGGQAIPALDFYLAPYVRASFIEEVDNLQQLVGKDLSHLKEAQFKDYLKNRLTVWRGMNAICNMQSTRL